MTGKVVTGKEGIFPDKDLLVGMQRLLLRMEWMRMDTVKKDCLCTLFALYYFQYASCVW